MQSRAIAQHLANVRLAANLLAQSAVIDREIFSESRAMTDYARTLIAHEQEENLRIFYLDAKCRLIGEMSVEGSIDEIRCDVRTIVKRGLLVGAAGMVIAHNHPSGDPTPSKSDRAFTRSLYGAADPLGIRLHEHIIVSSAGNFSFRQNQLL